MTKENSSLERAPRDVVIRAVSVLAPVLLLYFASFQVINYGNYPAGVVLVGLGVASAFTARLRATISPIDYICGLLVVAASTTAYFRGGLVPGVLLWLLFPPMVNLLAIRLRQALFWTLVVAAAIGLVGLLEQLGLTPPREESTEMGLLAGTIGALVGLTLIVFFQAWVRRQEQLERERMQRRLFRANKLESIARLAAGVAHDFGNLLTVVGNHTSMLSERLSDQTDREDLAAIQHAADGGAALTRQLLAIGRGRDHTEPSDPIDLNGVGAEVATLLSSLLDSSIRFEFSPAGVPPIVRANRWDVHQVLMNLVLNARNAMPCGGDLIMGIEVKDMAQPETLRFGVLNPGQYVVLSVSDQGVGMSESLMNQVVEPFFTTRGKSGGTGLGLSIVYGVARSLDGQMDISSCIDEGTCFSVYLPLCTEPISEVEDPRSASSSIDRPRVLLVDDTPPVRRSLERLLRMEGHSVVSASSASDARRRFNGASFDVLVTDVSMPGESGLELAISLVKESPSLGIVLVSGRWQDTPPELSQTGVRSLTKPCSREELANAVAEVSTRRFLRVPSAPASTTPPPPN